MKNIKGLERFINEDIESAILKLKNNFDAKVKTLQAPKFAIELGKEYARNSKRNEEIEESLAKKGYDVVNYGDEMGEVKLMVSNYSHNQVRTAPEVKALEKVKEDKISKLQALKRTYALKLIGGAESSKVLAELAKELAKITS